MSQDIYDCMHEAIAYKLSEGQQFSIKYVNEPSFYDLDISAVAEEINEWLCDPETTCLDDAEIHQEAHTLVSNYHADHTKPYTLFPDDIHIADFYPYHQQGRRLSL